MCICGLMVQAQLAPASSLAWCFLTGIVSVPEDVLRPVAPVLLVRLLHHLNSDSTATAGTTSSPAASSASQPLPQVILIMSPSPVSTKSHIFGLHHTQPRLGILLDVGIGCLLTLLALPCRWPTYPWLHPAGRLLQCSTAIMHRVFTILRAAVVFHPISVCALCWLSGTFAVWVMIACISQVMWCRGQHVRLLWTPVQLWCCCS